MATKLSSGGLGAIGLLLIIAGMLLACTPAIARDVPEGNLVEQAIKEVTEQVTGDGAGVSDGNIMEELPNCPCIPRSPWCCGKQALKELSNCPCSPRMPWCCGKQVVEELPNCPCSPRMPWCCGKQAVEELPNCPCSPRMPWCCGKQALEELPNCPCSLRTPWCC